MAQVKVVYFMDLLSTALNLAAGGARCPAGTLRVPADYSNMICRVTDYAEYQPITPALQSSQFGCFFSFGTNRD